MNPRRNFTRHLQPGLTALLLTALAALGAGCISTKETVYREEARLKVEFENDTAGRLFYEAVSCDDPGPCLSVG